MMFWLLSATAARFAATPDLSASSNHATTLGNSTHPLGRRDSALSLARAGGLRLQACDSWGLGTPGDPFHDALTT